ncbi:MAG TPA: hypothetical protein VNJ03_07580 [Vicinamibacterales bacterium]|nr:hypothetical protein [Vicinamibacterales bacterium]
MTFARTGLMAAAILSVASMAFAQTPDFSGTWTVDASAMPAPMAPATPPATPPAGAPAGRGGGRGMMAGPMTVTQTATTLTVARTAGENKIVTVYKLDGTESVNKQTMQGNEVEIKSMAKFDGRKLSIVTKTPAPDGTMRENTAVWTMDGGNLVIETTNARGTQKRVYKKTT